MLSLNASMKDNTLLLQIDILIKTFDQHVNSILGYVSEVHYMGKQNEDIKKNRFRFLKIHSTCKTILQMCMLCVSYAINH